MEPCVKKDLRFIFVCRQWRRDWLVESFFSRPEQYNLTESFATWNERSIELMAWSSHYTTQVLSNSRSVRSVLKLRWTFFVKSRIQTRTFKKYGTSRNCASNVTLLHELDKKYCFMVSCSAVGTSWTKPASRLVLFFRKIFSCLIGFRNFAGCANTGKVEKFLAAALLCSKFRKKVRLELFKKKFVPRSSFGNIFSLNVTENANVVSLLTIS